VSSHGGHLLGVGASASESSHSSGVSKSTSVGGHSSGVSSLSLASLELEVGNVLGTSDLMSSDESGSLGSSSSLSGEKHSLFLQPGSASLGL